MTRPRDPDNATIAGRLEAFAALLDLAGSSFYTVRAYRRAADLIRSTPASVAELVRAGRARELRGIGPGIEARLSELVETGDIAELAELERTTSPELVGLGRLLGVNPQRMLALAGELGVRTADEFRVAAREGRLRTARGIGPRTEQRTSDRPRGERAAARSPGLDAQPRLGARGRHRGSARRRGRR